MNNYPSISASIVTYNSNLGQLKRTLESISTEFSSIQPKGNSCEIILVDNNSNEAYRESLEKLVGEVNASSPKGLKIRLTVQRENRGFGHGHNIAARLSSSDIHLIANPDIFFHAGSLSCAIDEFRKDEELSLVLPCIYDGEGNQQFLHTKIPGILDLALRSIAPTFIKQMFCGRLKQLRDVPVNKKIFRKENIVFSGCLMLVNRKDFLSIGGFDEKFFLYFEDYDLSLRITEGKAAKICGDFLIDHFGGNTHKKSLSHKLAFLKSYLRFTWLHNPSLHLTHKK